jgi:hypothetical protein
VKLKFDEDKVVNEFPSSEKDFFSQSAFFFVEKFQFSNIWLIPIGYITLIMFPETQLSGDTDQLIWRWQENEKFITHSAYE